MKTPMKAATILVLLASILVLAPAEDADTTEPLVVPAKALRAVALGYQDLSAELARSEERPVPEFDATIYEYADKVEILFLRRDHAGMERRGGDWFYSIDANGEKIREKRRQK